MNKSVQQVQIFYEIAMSIGNSLDIRKMLKQALKTYLRKLNCLAGMVYKLNKISSEQYLFEELFSIPYTLNIKESYKEIDQKLSGIFSEKKLYDFYKEAPYFEKTYKENYYYIFKLGDFGLLLLVKPKPFEPEIIKLLDEVNKKLAEACEACTNNERIIESERKYRELSEMLPEMICESDLKGYITYANQYALEKMEYKPEDLDKGFHVMNLVAPEDQKRLINNFRKALKTENWTPNEYTVITKSGKKRSVIIYTSRIRQSDKVKGIRGVMIDITERKENENKIKTLSESTFEAIFFFKDGVCINQNYAAEKMFGYSLDEAIGKPGTDWIHPDYRDLVTKKMRDRKESPYEAVATRKDGTTFPCEIQGKVSLINDEQIRITALRDISTRKDAETAKKESEEKYSSIVNNANDGIYLRDMDGKIIFANKKFAEIHGYKVDETIGRKSWEFLHPESLEKIKATKEFDRVQDGFQTQGEEIGITKSGDKVYLDIRTAPLVIQGEISGIFGIVRNISERIEYERQLEEERDKAYQANKTKSEFLANMCHEIRTPMNAILGFNEALYHKLDTTSHKKMIKSILSSGNLLLSLLNDILDLSKIEAGKLEISPQPVDFKNIIEEIKLLFTDKAQKKGLEINLQIAPGFPDIIRLDEIRIKQVIFNLVGNAIKFTSKGYVNIKAGYYSMSDEKGDLVIEVEDSGLGISKLQKEKIFEAFIQQSGQSNRMFEGVGLGLAISKRLIEKMGGTIDVESTINKGSVFSVKIPDVRTSYVAIRENKTIDNIKNAVFNNANVLVVDDVITNIETVENLLMPVGLSVTSAENGEIALELLNHTIPDLILLDLRLPGINGFEVAKKIKENPKTAKTPVIAFTASVFSSDRMEQSGNFDGFLFKPVNRNELLSTLSKYLDHRFKDQTELLKQDELDPGVIDDEIKNQLPELIHELKTKMLPEWETIKDQLVLYKIEEFASELNKLAHKFQLKILISYANKLLEDLEFIDLESLNETIKAFPGIIKQIESIIK